MKVLVTGSAGRIGGAIVQCLRPLHAVVGLDLRPAAEVDMVGDLREQALLQRALRGVDAVVHVAALHAPQVGSSTDAEFESINVGATRQLIDAALAAGVGRIVYTSTTALYGSAATPSGRAGWVDEDLPPQPRTIYHRTKLAAEALLERAARDHGLGVTVLRMSRCFPEPAPLMAAYRLHRGVDARDVAQAHALALRASAAGLRRFVISGATPFQPHDMAELARDAASVWHRRAPALVQAFEQRAWPLPETVDRVYCAQRAALELGWRPRFGFEEVLREWDQGSPQVLPPLRQRSACE